MSQRNLTHIKLNQSIKPHRLEYNSKYNYAKIQHKWYQLFKKSLSGRVNSMGTDLLLCWKWRNWRSLSSITVIKQNHLHVKWLIVLWQSWWINSKVHWSTNKLKCSGLNDNSLAKQWSWYSSDIYPPLASSIYICFTFN